jgi:hypothetical protein
MTTRTWIGGGDNQASNPNDWIDSNGLSGAPQPGDTLTDQLSDSTMNITDNALAGNGLSIVGFPGPPVTGVTLNLSDHAQASLSLAFASVVANVDGQVNLQANLAGVPASSSLRINMAPNTNLFSTNISIGSASGITIKDDSGTGRFHNDGSFVSSSSAVIDTAVVGVGTIIAGVTRFSGGRLEFGGSVSDGQTVQVGDSLFVSRFSTVQLDDPRSFHGTIEMTSFRGTTTADLVGLPEANSWIYSDGLLTIRGTGGNVIDTLHVVNAPGSSFPGLAVSMAGNDVIVHPGTDFSGSFALPTT